MMRQASAFVFTTRIPARFFSLSSLSSQPLATPLTALAWVRSRLLIPRVIIDHTRQALDDKWICQEGPRFGSPMPIKWKIVEDPVDGGKRVEKPLVSMFFNGRKTHTNVRIQKVWGGPNSGVDGGNDGGKGITGTPQGVKLQCEGHDIHCRNAWIKELDLPAPDTDFQE